MGPHLEYMRSSQAISEGTSIAEPPIASFQVAYACFVSPSGGKRRIVTSGACKDREHFDRNAQALRGLGYSSKASEITSACSEALHT